MSQTERTPLDDQYEQLAIILGDLYYRNHIIDQDIQAIKAKMDELRQQATTAPQSQDDASADSDT